MRSVVRWLVGNLGLIVLSLTMSVLVWTAAVEQENPTSERRYSSPIVVTIPDPPPGMIAYGETNPQVHVTLRAPKSVWDNLRVDDIRAAVDLGDLEEGTHAVPVQVEVNKEPVMVREIDPEVITIQLEPLEEAVVPVRARIEGNTALGFVARPPVATPSSVTVTGPASKVAQVVEAVTSVSVDGGRADVMGEYALEPHDAEGGIVQYVGLLPTSVAVHVPIEQLSGFRDLAVTALVEGLVAPGYRISSITVDPPVVTVYGTPDAISQIPGYLETAPLDLEAARDDVEVRLPLVAPDGVSLLMDEPVVTVKVAVAPLEGSLTIERTVEIQGLAAMTATVAPATVEVILGGPLPVLEQLRDEDVRVIVDLFGLNPGSHSVEPQVVVAPLDVAIESVLPASVQVEITASGTATPGG